MRIPDFHPTGPDVHDQKAMLRRALLARRAEVTPETARHAAQALSTSLPRHALLRDVDPGPILVPTRHRTEIETAPAARALEAAGWTIARPRTHPDDPELEVVPWPADGTLVPGRWGVPEPPADATAIAPQELVAVLVPGVGFDQEGGRLGMGSGIFDRFLPRIRGGVPVIGIGYRFQLVDAVPREAHDVPLAGLQLEGHGVTCRGR